MKTESVEGGGVEPMRRLKAATRARHRATERTPLARRLAAGTLSLEEYAAHLQVFRRLWAELEEALDRSAAPAVRVVWSRERAKTPLLDADLAELREELGEAAALPAPVEVALERGAPLAAAPPGELLGRLYVLEGSTLGGAVLAPRIARGLGLPAERMRYYHPYGPRLRAMWGRFAGAMNAALACPRTYAAAARGAQAGFEEVRAAFEAVTEPRAARLAASA